MYGSSTRIGGVDKASIPSMTVTIYMAGSVDHAKQVVRKFCRVRPSCVTVTPTDYVYDGGEEAGFSVSFRAYPRFPSEIDTLPGKASDLAGLLMDELGQRSYMIDDGVMVVWVSSKEPK